MTSKENIPYCSQILRDASSVSVDALSVPLVGAAVGSAPMMPSVNTWLACHNELICSCVVPIMPRMELSMPRIELTMPRIELIMPRIEPTMPRIEPTLPRLLPE